MYGYLHKGDNLTADLQVCGYAYRDVATGTAGTDNDNMLSDISEVL